MTVPVARVILDESPNARRAVYRETGGDPGPYGRRGEVRPLPVGSETLKVYAKTDTGQVRDHNEDSYFAGPHPDGSEDSHGRLFLLADGMGGHAAGEVASALAVESAADRFYASSLRADEDPGPRLREAFEAANHAILEAGSRHVKHYGMGTTLTAVLVRGGRFWICHVGDSRAYRFRGGQLERLTRDHTLLQDMIDTGNLRRQEVELLPLGHILVRAMGKEEDLEVDLSRHPYPLLAGDRVLLCSDGLSAVLPDDRIAAILESGTGEVAVETLVSAANQEGGPDNITVLLLERPAGKGETRDA